MNSSGMVSYQGIVLSSILRDMSVEGVRHMLCRRSHGFILKLKGKTEYRYNDKTLTLSEGQVLFVPKGSSYYIKEVTPGYSYVVNFESAEEPFCKMNKLTLPENLDLSIFAEKMYRKWQKENVYGTLSCLYALLEKNVMPEGGYISIRDRQLLEPVEAYLSEYLTDAELKLETLPEISGVSGAYLRRIFKRRYGVSPAGYVTRERIKLACQMLTSGEERSVSKIAEIVGYKDALYFSRIFKKQTGVSPSDYRLEHMVDLF